MTTYGIDKANCGVAARMGNFFKHKLMGWPVEEVATPAAKWHVLGEPDPHGDRYDGERAKLTLGHYTDDELANGAFLNYDVRLPLEAMLRPQPGQHMPIIWMTAVKDRIRWLSRALVRAAAIDVWEMNYCEHMSCSLHPGVTYRFKVDPECASCTRLARDHDTRLCPKECSLGGDVEAKRDA